jgi:hypothetical protein
MTTRCKSTFTRHSGEVLQCEHNLGHDSVHYNGDVWWPNKCGLPFRQRATGLGTSFWRWLFHLLGGNKP